MGTKFVFGRSIAYQFNPIIGDEDTDVDSLVSARLYKDVPTDAQLENQVGAPAPVSSTNTMTGTAGRYLITFPAVTDPDPHSSNDYETYHVVVNFKYESGGPTVFLQEILWLYRPDALTSSISTVPADIFAWESKLEMLMESAKVATKIDRAIKKVDRDLRAMGYDRRRTFNREKLGDAVELLAVAFCCFDQGGQGNPEWLKKADKYLEWYEEAKKEIPVGYDIAGNDAPAPTESVSTGPIVVMR